MDNFYKTAIIKTAKQMCSFTSIQFCAMYMIISSLGHRSPAFSTIDFKHTPTLLVQVEVFMKSFHISFELCTSVTCVALLTLQLLTQASL